METGSACTIDNTHAAIADAVLSAARKNTAVHTVYVAGSSGTMLARFRAYFEANASSLPAVGGRPRAIRLMTIADIMPNLSHAHVRADTNGMHGALADLWALGATATLFRARSSTFGMLAAILNNELKRSVIVESSSCGDLSDGSDLASARHSFCGNHGAAGDAEARDQVLPLAPLPVVTSSSGHRLAAVSERTAGDSKWQQLAASTDGKTKKHRDESFLCFRLRPVVLRSKPTWVPWYLGTIVPTDPAPRQRRRQNVPAFGPGSIGLHQPHLLHDAQVGHDACPIAHPRSSFAV
jgi:hypothetical protein